MTDSQIGVGCMPNKPPPTLCRTCSRQLQPQGHW